MRLLPRNLGLFEQMKGATVGLKSNQVTKNKILISYAEMLWNIGAVYNFGEPSAACEENCNHSKNIDKTSLSVKTSGPSLRITYAREPALKFLVLFPIFVFKQKPDETHHPLHGNANNLNLSQVPLLYDFITKLQAWKHF